MSEMVLRMNSIDSLYHAAQRYERDQEFRRGVPDPDWVANCLRENARRIEKMHEERKGATR